MSITRREEAIAAEAALDGIYVLRTTIKADDLDAPGVVEAYKALAPMSNATFATSRSTTSTCARSITAWKPGCAPTSSSACSPPIWSGTSARRWLRSPSPTRRHRCGPTPSPRRKRSAAARAKAAAKVNGDGQEVRGFRELLEHLGTLTRNTMRTTAETTSEFELLATPTPTQRRVFELLGAPVPLQAHVARTIRRSGANPQVGAGRPTSRQ